MSLPCADALIATVKKFEFIVRAVRGEPSASDLEQAMRLVESASEANKELKQ